MINKEKNPIIIRVNISNRIKAGNCSGINELFQKLKSVVRITSKNKTSTRNMKGMSNVFQKMFFMSFVWKAVLKYRQILYRRTHDLTVLGFGKTKLTPLEME